MMFFIWAPLLIIIILAFLYFGKRKIDLPQPRDQDILEALKNRYARGDISKEEFEWGKNMLQDEL